MHFDKIDAALEGVGQYAGKAYFFREGAYVRYDWKLDREDFGYPQPITAWPLPPIFQTGVDAAFNGQGAFATKAYFIRDSSYARYDWSTGKVDLINQPLSKWKLPPSFLNGIDATLNGQGVFSGKTYFFKGDKYVRYDWASDTVDSGSEGIGKSIGIWKFPGALGNGIDAAINGDGPFLGKAYVFKDSEYARYNWITDQPDPDYPKPINHNWKHGVSIWAFIDTATNVPLDARLREDDGSTLSLLPYPQGTTRGQAGWDVGISFGSLKSLATKIRYQPIALPDFICGEWLPWKDCGLLQKGQLSRLAINAHGESGEVAINGLNNPVVLTKKTLATNADLRVDLAAIRDVLDPGATLLFMGCRAGHSLGGNDLLEAVSEFMPGRKIVAFTTMGYSNGGAQARKSGHGVTEPGMRDTKYAFKASSEFEDLKRYSQIWDDLDRLPWASEDSPHAKVALNGKIIQGKLL